MTELNLTWQSDPVKLNAVHIMIKKELLKTQPLLCTKCGSKKNVQVASINGHKYTDDIRDYTFLCSKCHNVMDAPYKKAKILALPTRNKDALKIKRSTEKCSMPQWIADIAISYCHGRIRNPSRGIMEMAKKIKTLKKEYEVRLKEYEKNKKEYELLVQERESLIKERAMLEAQL